MTVIHMITLNQKPLVPLAINSVKPLGWEIIVTDIGSTDGTIETCVSLGAKVVRMNGQNKSSCRQNILDKYHSVFYIEPWEMLIEGHNQLKAQSDSCYITIIHNKTVTKDIRFYNKGKFKNPVFEFLDIQCDKEIKATIYSNGGMDQKYIQDTIQQWKQEEPLSPQPYYYQACLLLQQAKYDEFLKVAEHYLFLDKSNSIPVIMTRYYYALVCLLYKRSVQITLKNLNLCLCSNPLMAEFWCLTGDVYYHLLNKFDLAEEFYKNAIIMGGRRLKTDRWPMDIVKYKQYPEMMIKSCEEILKSKNSYQKL